MMLSVKESLLATLTLPQPTELVRMETLPETLGLLLLNFGFENENWLEEKSVDITLFLTKAWIATLLYTFHESCE